MNKDHAEDLALIRKMMEDSSRFLTLSGLSGVIAGVYALLGAAIAFFLIMDGGSVRFDYSSQYILSGTNRDVLPWLFLDAGLILFLAIGTAFILSRQKAKREGKTFWTMTAKRMIVHLFIPLLAAAALILAMMFTDSTILVASSMLIFYGLALINASKYTLGEIKYLGFTELALGIISLLFLGYGFIFWVLGFGVMHIVYGFIMWKRYK